MACLCGCGETPSADTRSFVAGHWNRPCRSPDEFAVWKPARDALRLENGRARSRVNAAQRRKDFPDDATERRRMQLWTRYRITPDEYKAMLASQGGVCAVCGTDDPKSGKGGFVVDHAHESGPYNGGRTGDIRGALCGRCNMALGQLGHDVEVLRAAIVYLSKDPAIKR